MHLQKSISTMGLLVVISCSLLQSVSFAENQSSMVSPATNLVSPAKNIDLQRFAFSVDLVDAALERLDHKVTYDGSYREIAFPGGDVPNHIGVCTDVIVRSYRKLGIDLQERVHQDMLQSFAQYPNLPKWDRVKPDTNIDHRRVLNLRVFFERHGAALPISTDANDYLPGDMVTWDILPGMPHIGIVTHNVSEDKTRPLIVHNMGKGPQLEDVLFTMKITGHYRYQPGLQFNPSLTYQANTSQ